MKIKGSPDIKLYVVHHSAVSRATQPLQRDAINEFHRTKDWGGGWRQPHPSELGWWGGYNFYTEPTGERTQFRYIGEETIANVGHNCAGINDCDAISHCFGGNFATEGMTEMQVADLKRGFAEAKAIWPDIKIVQHSDVQPGRTCAELSSPWLEALVAEPEKETAKQTIARLEKEIEGRDKMIKQLVFMVTSLLKIVKK